jgi:hypothetical protein
MARRTCKICGADVGSAEFSTCGRHACQRAAMGLPPATPDATQILRDRLADAGRRREVVWLTGRVDLLCRCATFGPLAQAQPR